jgi:hypothetical protein
MFPEQPLLRRRWGLRRFALTSGLIGLAAMMGIAGVELRLYLAATRPRSN